MVEVQAKIIVGDARENRAKLHVKNNVTVTLKLEGDVARLVCTAADELYDGSFLDREAKTRFHLDIKVPQHIAIVITNQSGSVKVKNVERNVSVQSGHSDLTVSDIVGNLDVQTDKGKVEISDIRGDIVVRDGTENLVVRNVKGKVDVANKSGNVDIADVDGNVHISDGSSNVTLNKIKGDVVIPSAAKGKVVLERIDGSVKIN